MSIDMRAPSSRSDHVVLVDDERPWLALLHAALEAQGLTVQRAPSGQCAFAAFVSGASAILLQPDLDQSIADTWMQIVDRASHVLPTSVVLLPESRREEVPGWLAAGFDDVVVGEPDAAAVAARIRARTQSRAVRHSLSSVDPLTGLPTQEVFFSRLDPTIRLSSRASMPMAVAVVDLDGFIALEKTWGREVARRLLIDVARHLQAALRRSDTVARLGDDRFGLILNHITAFEARRLMYKLWRSLTLTPETAELIGEGASRVTFTAGIGVFPGDSSEPHELYTRAEIALDVARATGQRRVLLYSETCGDSGEDRHGTDLRYHRVQGMSRDEPE
jgi:diguanylate cyclase (GGDEF)-like protein